MEEWKESMATPEFPKPTVLVVDDERGPRDALTVILRPFFDLHAVENAQAALRVLKEKPIDLVTLDLKLPDRPGIDLLQEIKLDHSDVEVIIITGYGSLKSAMDGIRYGAAGYLLKPFNVMELITLINDTLRKKQRLDRLREFVRTTGKEGAEPDLHAAWSLFGHQYISQSQAEQAGDQKFGEYTGITSLLSDLIEGKSRDLFNHSSRVSFFSTRLGKHLSFSTAERRALAIGAFLHDIGKLGVEDRILVQTDQATPQDEAVLKRHPEIGARMILPLNVPAGVNQIIAYHHEQYDGSGYPDGLQGEGIPLLARVVCIAQAFDHSINSPFLPHSLSADEAMKQIQSQAGSRFDPLLVDLFAHVVNECKTSLPSFAMSFGPATESES
jgi:putative nucleotidyltransferase with HDIG domain